MQTNPYVKVKKITKKQLDGIIKSIHVMTVKLSKKNMFRKHWNPANEEFSKPNKELCRKPHQQSASSGGQNTIVQKEGKEMRTFERAKRIPLQVPNSPVIN